MKRSSLVFVPVVCAIVASTLVGCARSARSPTRTFTYDRGAVAADHPQASAAGAEMLAMGGNAVDAAVATSFALCVTRPYSTGIGGGGFILIHLQDDPRHGSIDIAIDARERAPALVEPDHFEVFPDFASSFSGHAVATPGLVAGLLHALENYGSLDRQTVLAPAIRLARQGFLVDDHTRDAIAELTEALQRDDRMGSPDGDEFLRRTYVARRSRDILTNPQLADCLERIAADGAPAFYEGEIAEAIVRAVEQAGGVLSRSDLADYRISLVDPIRGSFRGHSILSMPLPSSGGVMMLQALALIEKHPLVLRRSGPTDPDYAHLLIESFKHAFSDRAAYLGDPEFMDADPTSALLDRDRIDLKSDRLDMQHARDPDFYAQTAPLPDDAGTSHFSVVDAFGNAVACSETINLVFGSRVAVAEYGFCLNSQMDDFTTSPGEPNEFGLVQSERNVPEPGKRPLSSMTPTIVLDETGQVEMILGASGGPRIITAVTQVLLNVLIFDMDAGPAVAAPRLHHQWLPNELYLEDGLRELPKFAANLAIRGHIISDRPKTAVVQLIRRDDRDRWQAASDHRKGGRPAGQ